MVQKRTIREYLGPPTVSTITLGIPEHILHIFTKHFQTSPIVLTQLAPGMISAATTNVHIPTTVDVARQVSQITNDNVVEVCSAQWL